MKRTCVIACVALAATLVFGSGASAFHWSWWDGFQGKYEMTATGICNHSTKGWVDGNGKVNGNTPPWTPVEGSKIWAANATIQATFQFKRNGTGSFSGTNYISLLPGGQPIDSLKDQQVSQSPVGGQFKYEITNDGEITITTGGGTIMTGAVSRDWNVINLINANQIMDLTNPAYGYDSFAIQNMMRVLVRMGD